MKGPYITFEALVALCLGFLLCGVLCWWLGYDAGQRDAHMMAQEDE